MRFRVTAPPLILSTLILITSFLLLAGFFVVSAIPGALETSWNGDGEFNDANYIGGTQTLANAVTLGADDDVWAAGYVRASDGDNHLSVWKLDDTGTLDTSFDSDGRLDFLVDTGIDEVREIAYGIVYDSNGDIVVVGESDRYNSGSETLVMAKLNDDGSLDTSFGSSGKFNSRNLPTIIHFEPEDAVIDSSDNIYAAGRYGRAGVWKFDNDGDPVSSYGNLVGSDYDGIAQETITDQSWGYAATIDSQGRIILVGRSRIGSDYYASVWRFTTSGDLDTTFDSDGMVGYGYSTDYAYAYDVTVDDNDEIIVVGRYTDSSLNTFVWRLNTDGSFDTAFDTDGRMTYGTSENSDVGNSQGRGVAINNDGQYMVGIHGDAYGGVDEILMIRVNTDGSIDTDFGNNGLAVSDDTYYSSLALGGAMVVNSEDTTIVGGNYNAPGGLNMVLWAFRGGEFNDVDIDVRPGECTALIDVDTTDVITVVVNGSASFDVTDINTSSVLFDGASPVQTFVQDMSDSSDCDGYADTYDDLVARFRISDLSASLLAESDGATPTVTLTADLTAGDSIIGDATVEIIND